MHDGMLSPSTLDGYLLCRRSEDNPDGYTVLAVAENRQSIDILQERLARIAPIPR